MDNKSAQAIKYMQAQKYYSTGRLATPKMLELLAHRLARKGFRVFFNKQFMKG
jgi:hypothetical protein